MWIQIWNVNSRKGKTQKIRRSEGSKLNRRKHLNKRKTRRIFIPQQFRNTTWHHSFILYDLARDEEVLRIAEAPPLRIESSPCRAKRESRWIGNTKHRCLSICARQLYRDILKCRGGDTSVTEALRQIAMSHWRSYKLSLHYAQREMQYPRKT